MTSFRDRFYFPQHDQQDAIYLCGNSLGLQPKAAEPALLRELQQWRELGIEGFFTGENRWLDYHRYLQPLTAPIVGAAEPEETIVMNTLTVNLHLLLVSFYRPTSKRFKLIMEAGAFPSDQYALVSQVQHHGFDPATAIVEVTPREGEIRLRTEDIVATIEREGAATAVVLFGGVNYYTGQLYDMAAITHAAHAVGAYAGFDLAHAAGNVPLRLHDWQVDFAVWCTYKYLNSGPGGPSGAFVHARHRQGEALPRFAGWWGHDPAQRFLMRKGFQPARGATGWQLSTAQILPFAVHRASLEIFAEAGMEALRQRSLHLTQLLASGLARIDPDSTTLRLLTPADPAERGCQLSLYVAVDGKKLFDHLTEHGVIVDWREDNLFGSDGGVIRVAPTPLYNTEAEIARFLELVHFFINES